MNTSLHSFDIKYYIMIVNILSFYFILTLYHVLQLILSKQLLIQNKY